MKLDKQIPISSSLDTRTLPQVPLRDPPAAAPQQPGQPEQPPTLASASARQHTRLAEKHSSKESGFSLQLNQQLTAMQSADHYLTSLTEQLSTLKLNLSRQLASPQSLAERDSISWSLEQANTLLEQRRTLSGGSLDATFRLRLTEPLRSHVRLQGLDSIEQIQRSGRETLVFTAGRALPEPMAVVLDDGMSADQVLRRFNSGLGSAGIRAELDQDGDLKFSAPEQDWRRIAPQLRVRGEGKLFGHDGFVPVVSHEDGWLAFTFNAQQDSPREMRQLLDSVVTGLDRIGALREQIGQRQEDVREFLARQESLDEQQWALHFASAIFRRNGQSASSYAVLSQTVMAQAQLTRFEVVSLLS